MATGTSDFLPRLIRQKPARKYTLEEYLRKEGNSAYKHEFINGEIIKMPNAKYNHNLIAMNVAVEMTNTIEESERNYLVFTRS